MASSSVGHIAGSFLNLPGADKPGGANSAVIFAGVLLWLVAFGVSASL
jgi:hypothetical protein